MQKSRRDELAELVLGLVLRPALPLLSIFALWNPRLDTRKETQ
jgi:hypothetical protein